MSESIAIQWTAILVSIGIFKHSLELIAAARRLPDESRYTDAVIGMRLLLAVVAIFFALRGIVPAWVPALQFFIEIAHHYRFRLLRTGFYTINLVVLAALTAATIDPKDPDIRCIAFAFIACMASLVYFKNGWAKLMNPAWRNGKFLPEMLLFSHYRMPWAGRILAKHRVPALFLTWIVILFEMAFPIALFTTVEITLIFLSFGILFHFGNAFLLRLPGFFWSFVSTYPACLYFACKANIPAT